jgi:argininosuccinate lyase
MTNVLVVVNLYLKDVVIERKPSESAFDLLMESAEKYQNVLLPGYTHTNCDAVLFSDCGFLCRDFD